MGARPQDKPAVPPPQPAAWVRAGLLALLPALLGMVWWTGQSFDPGLIRFEAKKAAKAAALPSAVAGHARAGPARTFNVDTLYEYVNGHAEYYIKAGFEELTTAEYGPADKPVLVVDAFDMGKPLHAFGVLMDEAGKDRKAIDVGDMGFKDGGGIRFIAGRHYVRITFFAPVADPVRAARDVGLEKRGAPGQAFRFPDYGKITATRFIKENYRGLDFLADVVERDFETGSGTFTAFLVLGDGGPDAAKALLDFLKSDGIAVEARDIPGGTVHLIDDPYEGPWFAALVDGRLTGGFGALTPDLEKVLAP